jgi:hypothetical protein
VLSGTLMTQLFDPQRLELSGETEDTKHFLN